MGYIWLVLSLPGNYHDSLSDAKAATELQPNFLKAFIRGKITIRVWARDFYDVIVDEAEGRINYRLIEIESV